MAHRILLAGFGNVGQAVTRLIAEGHPVTTGLAIAGVSDPRFGTVVSDGAVEPDRLLAAAVAGGFAGLDGFLPGADVLEAIDAAHADTLVEATFTDLTTGEPATTHVRHALAAGMNVSTTNKGPIALHLPELQAMAEQHGGTLACEGTVMSGSPALLLATDSVAGAGFVGLDGILNGTTNYMVGRMEEGATYEAALAEAQRHGYAEADPAGDVEGHDAAGKLVILARLLLGVALSIDEIERIPMRTLTPGMIGEAVTAGDRWRYVAGLERRDGVWRGAVAPRRLPSTHPLAGVSGATNAITFHTELLGDVTLVGPGAGRLETAYAVLSDLRRIAQGCR